jgi:acetoin utilization deacetylase AcuC-like enzyme
MKKTGFLISGFRHDTGAHPESIKRLQGIEEVFHRPELEPHLQRIFPRAAEVAELCEIHERGYVLQVQKACAGGIHALDPDTIISPESYEEARLAAGGVLAAMDAVVSGEVKNAFCAVRPPGHHAERDRAMGFCLFNNVAVAARYAQKKHNLQKVLIVDWDVHHGNGTQNSFYEDASVFYFSIHQYPHYPGTGTQDQSGKGAGKGFTMNIPFPVGCGDEEYREIFERILIPEADRFAPDLILISAGFDAHKDDPLAGIQVTAKGFGYMTEALARLADRHCGGRLVSMLEGGYNISALKNSVKSHLSALIQA